MRGVTSCGSMVLTLVVLSACALCPPIDPQQKLIAHFDDYIIPLAKAIDVIIDTLPPEAADDQILAAVVERTGSYDLIKPFDGYVLKARIEGDTGVVLLCSPNGEEALIEDVTCTARPDSHRPTGSPCIYLLEVKRVCDGP